MSYEVSFGSVAPRPRATAAGGKKFRLALLGDFSGRANAGRVEIGAALAARKPLPVDVDNLDDVLGRMLLSLALPLGEDGATVAVPIAEMDDFHPDQLAENVGVFESLLDLRRNLNSKGGFDRAAKEVLSWGDEAPLPPAPRQARGSAVAARRLSEFSRLIDKPAPAREAATDDLVRRLVGPFVVPARDARQDQLVARVDEALSAAMRRVLHHPDFQTTEALWRGVELLVRRVETDDRTQIVLYDVSAEELAADLAATDALEDTGLFGMLAEAPPADAHQGALSAVIGLYQFDLAPPHADLLGRIAQIAAAAGAPFVASIGPDTFGRPMRDQHPLVQDAFSALFRLPQAAYLGLASPRFLLRMPYGHKTDPIDAFAFEEFTRQSGLSGMLWGHPGLIAGLLLAETWAQQGAKMKLGTVLGVGDMPFFVYIDPDGDQVALPCTERLWSERQAVGVQSYRVMPLLSLRGRPEVRLGGLASIAGSPLAGFWAPVAFKPPAPPPPPAAVPESAAPEQEPEPEAVAAAPPPPEAPPDTSELDALLAGLETPAEAPAAAAPEPPSQPAEEDLDALLASLNAEPPPPAEDQTEADLDALLASLK